MPDDRPENAPEKPASRREDRGGQNERARREREAALLRENLAKRKTQQRSRRLCRPEKA